jgi:hypothetical protein
MGNAVEIKALFFALIGGLSPADVVLEPGESLPFLIE